MIQGKKFFVLLALLIMTALMSPAAASAAGETDCTSLATYAATLTDTTFGWKVFSVTSTWTAATATVPEYCTITGYMWPQIKFAVVLPTTWNNRFIHFGGGGWDGMLGGPTGGVAVTLNQGYAYSSSNGGYDSSSYPTNNGGLFGLKDPYFRMDYPSAGMDNPNACQKVVDFGLRSHRETPLIAKKLINRYYGSNPTYSYYSGQSCGGKEGQIAAQKDYDIYDGYFIGCPLGGHMVVAFRGMWDTKKGVDLNAQVDPACVGTWWSPCPTIYSAYKAALHYKTVYDKCDGVDGLVDGLIDDPRKCNFNAITDLPACSDDTAGVTSTTCFTLPQRQAIADIYKGPYDSKGNLLYVGQPLGSEYVTASGTSGFASALSDSMSIGMFQFIAFDPPPGPTWKTADFDFDKDTKTVQKTTCTQCYEETGKCVKYNIHNTVDGITLSPNPKPNMGGLANVKKKGAKILQMHGWADSLVSALGASANFYDGILNSMGTAQTKSFYKLYMVPGQGHCSGGLGVNPTWTDAFTALTNWVEHGTEPTTIAGSRSANTDANYPLARTRPLCPYPEVTRYNGTDSIELAASFSCVPPIAVKFSQSTIKLSSSGMVTATITVPKGYTMKDWTPSGFTLQGATMRSGAASGQNYTAKFKISEMTGVTAGNAVSLTVRGKFHKTQDAVIQASNTVKVTP